MDVPTRRGRLGRLLVELALGTVLALFLLLVPLAWLGPLVAALQVPLAVVMIVCLLGKLLYDTLFYDHYRP